MSGILDNRGRPSRTPYNAKHDAMQMLGWIEELAVEITDGLVHINGAVLLSDVNRMRRCAGMKELEEAKNEG